MINGQIIGRVVITDQEAISLPIASIVADRPERK